MAKTTTPEQRQMFYRKHQARQSYQQIADEYGLSREVVRKWCRRQRAGSDVETRYDRNPAGILSAFDPLAGYVVLRLRLAHPRWGSHRILDHLKRRPSLRGLALPSPATIGRYLRQWSRFRLPQPTRSQAPQPPQGAHECWQLDFKTGIALADGSQVNLHTVRDPVGEVCISAAITPAGRAGHAPQQATLADAQTTLRTGFIRWGTLPDAIQPLISRLPT